MAVFDSDVPEPYYANKIKYQVSVTRKERNYGSHPKVTVGAILR